MLAEVDALPRAQVEPPVRHRDGQAGADQDRLDVGRHVVRPFVGVGIVGRVVGRQRAEVRLQVGAHLRVGVLHDRQRGGGVLNEEVRHAHAQAAQAGQVRQHLVGDQVEAACARGEGEGGLLPVGHDKVIRDW